MCSIWHVINTYRQFLVNKEGIMNGQESKQGLIALAYKD